MFKKMTVAFAGLTLAGVSNAAVDFSQITTGVNFESASTAVVAVGVGISAVYIAIAGTRAVLRMIKSA